MKNLKLIFLGVVFLAACSPENAMLGNRPQTAPAVTPPAPKPEKVVPLCTAKGGGPAAKYNPKVDILFVVDHSLSMEEHQLRFANSIDSFVNAFAQNKSLDFQIGITTVWDSKYYGVKGSTALAPNQKLNKVLHPEIMPGELLPLKICGKDSKNCDKIVQRAAYKQGFAANSTGYKLAGYEILQSKYVTRETPNYLKVLKDSLKVGVLPVDLETKECPHCSGGVENEEMFTPVRHALQEPMLTGPNKGFIRPDAHLIIVFLTDAKDDSDISASALFQEVVNAKGGKKEMVGAFAVMVDPFKKGPSCKSDPSGIDGKIQEFINLFDANQKMFINLCEENWGRQLGKLGEMVKQQVSRKVIQLDCLPDEATLKVKYGEEYLVKDDKIGWSYDSAQKAIIINPGVNIIPKPGAEITVEAAQK